MYHCKSWMHPKKVELRSIKVKSHKYFHSPANPDSLLGSRQGEGANRVIAEREKRKNKGTPLYLLPQGWHHAKGAQRADLSTHPSHPRMPLLSRKKKCVQQNHSTCTLFVLIK